MTIGWGAQSTQIHASEVYTLSKAVHGFAHFGQGSNHSTVSCKYDSVQSERDMNLSLAVKPPTEISVYPDIVLSVKLVSIPNCDLSVETRNLYSTDRFHFSNMHLKDI